MEYIGKRLSDPALVVPAAVLDRAAVKRNCSRMIAAVKALDLSWRAHIKTHKTLELTRLQIGDLPARIVVSTLVEAEKVLPLLLEYQRAGREVNMLYGFPIYASAVPRLAAVARALGGNDGGGDGGGCCVSVIVDHPGQVAVAQQLAHECGEGVQIGVFVKIDMGTHRSGVILGTPHCTSVFEAVHAATATATSGGLRWYGLYCHAGHSYDAREPWSAMTHLVSEFAALSDAAKAVAAVRGSTTVNKPLILSVGASPTAATLQHPGLTGEGGASTATVARLQAELAALKAQGYELEVHAGVQPVLDLQQLATHSWAPAPGQAAADDIALTVLADVASIYPGGGGRGAADDEVLVNVGCLGLSRETVKDLLPAGTPAYSGLGLVKPWEEDKGMAIPGDEFPRLPTNKGWWQVGRVSQEHGILTWEGAGPAPTPALGQRLQIWTNHACITSACYTRFLVVDRSSDTPDEIVEVWERWNQW